MCFCLCALDVFLAPPAAGTRPRAVSQLIMNEQALQLPQNPPPAAQFSFRVDVEAPSIDELSNGTCYVHVQYTSHHASMSYVM